MNNAKMWLVVPPAVGVPVFLGAVAVGSFAVHVAVVSNTNWVSDFLKGQEMDEMASVVIPGDAETAKVAYTLPMENCAQEITIVMPDGTAVRAILQPNEVLASAAPTPLLQTH